jgi:hypothetical protein
LDEKPTERPHKRVAYRPREVAEMVGMIECELNVKAAHRYWAAVADVDPTWSTGV